MARREFPRSIKVAVIKRATKNSEVWCEKCGQLAKRWQIDHVIADSIGGEPVIDNAMLICEPCYSKKNQQDTTRAAKTKRQEAKGLGVRPTPTAKLKSRGFAPTGKAPRIDKSALPKLGPRALYEGVRGK
jgi:5-methylcytosine-specific restriction endonuclease McrA